MGLATPNRAELKAGIDEYSGRRQGTTDYTITEVSRLYKFKISKTQAMNIKKHSDKFRKKVISGDEKYTAYMNDTCAEAAKDVLDDANIDTPDGKGYVITPNDTATSLISSIKFVNPYSWYDQFKKKYGQPFIYEHTGLDKIDPIFLKDKWKLIKGTTVPNHIATYAYHSDMSK